MKHDWDLLARVTRQEFCALAPAPHAAMAHGVGTDISRDLPLLWTVVTMLGPDRAVELGTRHGISTRTIVHALKSGQRRRLVTIDPDPACRKHLEGVDCMFLPSTGEDVFRRPAFSHAYSVIDFLMVDTDPHSFNQTWCWLETWVRRLVPGGCVAFHDIVAPPDRPEMQVADAVREWMAFQYAGSWLWREFPPETQEPEWNGGIGLLWRME